MLGILTMVQIPTKRKYFYYEHDSLFIPHRYIILCIPII